MTAQYLLDTNHFSGLWREQPPVVHRLSAEPRANFGVSLPSVGELWFMVFHSARSAANRRRLATLLGDFELLDFDRSAAVEFRADQG
jgi:predicted nucleic acid-binding protein